MGNRPGNIPSFLMPKNMSVLNYLYLLFSVILVGRKKSCNGIEYLVVQIVEHSFSETYEVNDTIGYTQIGSDLSVDVLGKGIRLFPVLKRTGKRIQNLLFPVIQKGRKLSVFGYIGLYKSRIDSFKPCLAV